MCVRLHLLLFARSFSPPPLSSPLFLTKASCAQVYKCRFDNKEAAFKLFRATGKDYKEFEKSAFKEVEVLFALRHPNVIGLYAWCQAKESKVPQIGESLWVNADA